MQIKAATPQEYIAQLPEERQKVIKKLRTVINKNLPKGFKEEINYGMLGWVVPHTSYPEGYHCDPSKPLPFLNLASQKNFVALYHMGIYADPKLLNWFEKEYPKHVSTKLDMGKSCVRFKNMEHIPYELIAELMNKISPEAWVKTYDKNKPKK